MLKKIVILGPESTGKSTLCRQLAAHYNTEWVPEYAREYLLNNGIKYTYADLLTIAKGQVELENNFESGINTQPDSYGVTTPLLHFTRNDDSQLITHNSQLLFIDTNLYVMKVWCEFVFGKCHQFILDQIVERSYDLYLLCNIDLPWIADELREYPDLLQRQQLYKIYTDLLINQAVPWVEISGNHDQRLQAAIGAVNKILL
ncbi:MAG: AAA family ATPase [Ferruginibacter sp.]|nr:AAA family ATPase [Chitinophagaceae bacterium]